MPTVFPAETRTLLENIRWETFVELSEQRRGSVLRMTFDEGMLELMSPKRLHEGLRRLIGRMVETFTEVHGIEIQSVASTTFKGKDLGYESITESVALLGFTCAAADTVLAQRYSSGETALLRDYRHRLLK